VARVCHHGRDICHSLNQFARGICNPFPASMWHTPLCSNSRCLVEEELSAVYEPAQRVLTFDDLWWLLMIFDDYGPDRWWFLMIFDDYARGSGLILLTFADSVDLCWFLLIFVAAAKKFPCRELLIFVGFCCRWRTRVDSNRSAPLGTCGQGGPVARRYATLRGLRGKRVNFSLDKAPMTVIHILGMWVYSLSLVRWGMSSAHARQFPQPAAWRRVIQTPMS